MKHIIFLGFLLPIFICELTRHSGDVLERKRIFIEAHRGISNGQTNHNTKEAILDSIRNGVEAFETDAWLTKDKKVILMHDGNLNGLSCNDIPIQYGDKYIRDYKWEVIQSCETNEGYKIPLLEDIMEITKGKIFMNLEIKDVNEEIWDKILELIEKYEYYDQIAICSFELK